MSKVKQAAKYILSDIALFSTLILRIELYTYQLQPIKAVLSSVLGRDGTEFLLVFPRQSGKNEAIAHLLVYLMNLFQRRGGAIVFGAIADGLGRGIRRLEERLENQWNRPYWKRKANPQRRALGACDIIFLSTHPQAASRGETAHHLLVIDELQDQDAAHIEAVFEPMRAAHNATAVYLGTVRSKHDALWQKKQELERMTAADGIPRVFMVGPGTVTKTNPAYRRFLNAKIKRLGRKHPIIASEYFLEPIDAQGGFFNAERRALMRGTHGRDRTPRPNRTYCALLDVGGQDEAATDPLAQLNNPARDYTTCTIIEVVTPAAAAPAPGITTDQYRYKAVDIFVDQGSRHFQDHTGRPALSAQLLAFLQHWQVVHTIVDATGVGEGLSDWLIAQLGRDHVTPFKFSTSTKAALGSAFLALILTGRFKYWSDDETQEQSDGWWFWTQASACTYDLPAGGRFDKDLRWSVPETATIPTTTGTHRIHDDRLLSAALSAEIDRLIQDGTLLLGHAASAVGQAYDPLDDMQY